MILLEIGNSEPEQLHAMACKIESCTFDGIDALEFCDCSCNQGCQIKLPVFAKPGGTDYQNDKSSFLFRVLTATDSAAIKLFKKENNQWIEKVDLTASPTYGTPYPFGTWTTYPGQELYIGYQLNWSSVYTNFGHGEYYVVGELTVLGDSIEQRSDIFELLEYSDDRADGTFVIHNIQNGNIKRSPFDWTGMEWNQWLRLPGYFGFRRPTFITEEHLTNEYEEEQIQDEIRDEYTLEINEFLNGELAEELIYRRLLANKLFITDYNQCNTFRNKFINFPVKPSSIEDPFEDRYRAGILYEIKFTDRFKDNFKRNYK